MNGDSATWTIDRLARLAAAALAAGAPTQPNGRIREVPDVRTIRWYTSIGLLGRPSAMRGRTALYDRSHLAQLVAIKRLQAEGLTVAAVQERLLGADAAAIEEIAGLPADPETLLSEAEAETEDGAASARSKSRRAAAPDVAPSVGRGRFWASPAAAAGDEALAPDLFAESGAPAASQARIAPAAPQARTAPAAPTSRSAPVASAADIADAAPAAVHGIRLAADVTLLLPPGRVPDAADRTAIAEAARPLLALLERLGLSEA